MSHVHPSTRWKNMTWLSVSWKYSASEDSVQHADKMCTSSVFVITFIYILYNNWYTYIIINRDIHVYLKKERKKVKHIYFPLQYFSFLFIFCISKHAKEMRFCIVSAIEMPRIHFFTRLPYVQQHLEGEK